MDGEVSAPTTDHRYRTVDVPVAGGDLRVGVWDADDAQAPTVVLVHGVTASHLAWQWVAEALPEVRLVAPDLRGRGRSSDLPGPAGLAAHADDLATVFAHLELDPALVVGHSMGAFVAIVFAHRHPSLVTRLLLIDGGLPLATPPGLTPEALVDAVLGPTAARLSMRFADVAEYLRFWSDHPAFEGEWSRSIERYFAYDLVATDEGFRPATSYATTIEDTVDLHTGTVLTEALYRLAHRVDLITVPRGLQNETPGLYPPDHLDEQLAKFPTIRHERWEGLNHYTVVMTPRGARRVAQHIVATISPS